MAEDKLLKPFHVAGLMWNKRVAQQKEIIDLSSPISCLWQHLETDTSEENQHPLCI